VRVENLFTPGDLVSPRHGPFHGAHPVDQGVPVGGAECAQHRFGRGVRSDRRREVFGHGRAALPGIRGIPAAVRLRRIHCGLPASVHSPGSYKPRHMVDVARRPRTPRPPRGEALSVARSVASGPLAVDPAEARRLIQSLIVGQRGDVATLLVQHQSDPRRLATLALKPVSPRRRVDQQEFRQLHIHAPILSMTPDYGPIPTLQGHPPSSQPGQQALIGGFAISYCRPAEITLGGSEPDDSR
jgi:hypothetical protein